MNRAMDVHTPAQLRSPRQGNGKGRDAPPAPSSCEQLLAACAEAVDRAAPQAALDAELSATLAECALLCRTTRDAMRLQARTSRELRLICAAICHLCAEQCAARPEPWAARLAVLCTRCAESCRQVVALGLAPLQAPTVP